MEGAAQAVDADPVAGAFVAEARAPATGAFAAAVGGAANGVGAGSGDLEDSGTALKGCVEGDDLVADNLRALRAKVVEDRGDPFGDAGHGHAGHAAGGGADTGDTGLGVHILEQRAQVGLGSFSAYAQALDGAVFSVRQNPVAQNDRGAGVCPSAIDSQHCIHAC